MLKIKVTIDRINNIFHKLCFFFFFCSNDVRLHVYNILISPKNVYQNHIYSLHNILLKRDEKFYV